MTARPDRWEKAADRDLARRQRDAGPLFAPLVERRDPEAVRARAEQANAAFWERLRQGNIEMEARGQAAREILAAHISPEELARLDAQRKIYPPTAEYTADHYCGECRRRDLPWPGKEEHDAVIAGVEAEVLDYLQHQKAAAARQLTLPSGVRIALPRARIEALVPEEQEALEEAAEAELAAHGGRTAT